MGATVENNYDEPITLCAVLNCLRQQRVKKLSLSYESHLGEVVGIEVRREKVVNFGFDDSRPAEAVSNVTNITNIAHEPSEPPHSNS